MSNNTLLKVRLSVLNFIEFAVWGSYLTSLGNFLSNAGLAAEIGWFYAMQGIVSLFMPSLVGIIADRWVQAQRMLSLCHMLAALFMAGAGFYCMAADQIEFAPLFVLYSLSVAFFMPTIGLNNSVAFNALTRAGMDTVVLNAGRPSVLKQTNKQTNKHTKKYLKQATTVCTPRDC